MVINSAFSNFIRSDLTNQSLQKLQMQCDELKEDYGNNVLNRFESATIFGILSGKNLTDVGAKVEQLKQHGILNNDFDLEKETERVKDNYYECLIDVGIASICDDKRKVETLEKSLEYIQDNCLSIKDDLLKIKRSSKIRKCIVDKCKKIYTKYNDPNASIPGVDFFQRSTISENIDQNLYNFGYLDKKLSEIIDEEKIIETNKIEWKNKMNEWQLRLDNGFDNISEQSDEESRRSKEIKNTRKIITTEDLKILTIKRQNLIKEGDQLIADIRKRIAKEKLSKRDEDDLKFYKSIKFRCPENQKEVQKIIANLSKNNQSR